MKCQILFSGKNKKNIINLSSAEMFFWLQGINAAVKVLTQIVSVNSIGFNSWTCFLFMCSDSKQLGAVSHITQIFQEVTTCM